MALPRGEFHHRDAPLGYLLFPLAPGTAEPLLGFPFSFGVLQDYYSTHLPFSSQPEGISAIGTTCSVSPRVPNPSTYTPANSKTTFQGIMYLGAPLCFLAFQRWPRLGRRGPFFGLPIIVLGILLSSYASQIWHLVLTQGILYAIGGNLLYYPIFNYIDEWFVRRKGFAFGVMWAGTGCGGLAGPLVLHWGLGMYGVETFLRGWSIALVSWKATLSQFNSSSSRTLTSTVTTDRSILVFRQASSAIDKGPPSLCKSHHRRLWISPDRRILGNSTR